MTSVSNDGRTIRLGDSLTFMRELEPGSVDLVLTDPPYNVSQENNLDTMGRRGIEMEWDGDFDQLSWLDLAVRALRKGGSIVIWNDWKNLGEIAKELDEKHGFQIKRDLVWSKTNPMPRNTKRLPVQAREYAFWAVKPLNKSRGGWTFNFTKTPEMPYHRGEWFYPVQKALNRAKKPDGLFREIIELLSNPGELVLDPFVGCGTTLVAAEQAGRRALVFEKHRPFFDDAVRRWKEARVEAPC